MNNYYLLFFFVFIINLNGFAQENSVKHTVSEGETVISISQKYKVTPKDLYDLNPSLLNGFQVNDVILIPKSAVTSSDKKENKSPSQVITQTSDVIYHTVLQGETKYGLSKRYKISIEKLEQQNPHIISMLQTGKRLEIRGGVDTNPNAKGNANSVTTATEFISYEVLPKETLYGISKRYSLTVDQLLAVNTMDGVLKSGQILRIPVKNSSKTATSSNYHLVQAGETKYGLSKKYNISIAELENQNPQIVRMLQTGQQLIIPTKGDVQVAQNSETKITEPKVEEVKNEEVIVEEVKVEEPKTSNEVVADAIVETPKNVEEPKIAEEKVVAETTPPAENSSTVEKTVNESSTENNWTDYVIQPKETLYGLAKMAGVSQEKLIEVNPILTEGVKSGITIKFPSDKIPEQRTISEVSSNIPTVKVQETTQIGLLKSINKSEKKQVSFLLPFSNEKFLNFIKNPKSDNYQSEEMEFFAGANFAVDSLKKLGVSIELKNVNLEYNKDSKADLSVLKKNNVEQSNVIFYYFDKTNSDKISEFSAKNNIPFLINKVDESTEKFATTYTTIPSENDLVKMILNYINSKNGNLIVVSDAINSLNDDFILQHYPKARFVKVSEKDVLEEVNLTNELILNRKNFVLLNTDKIGLILNTTTTLLRSLNEYEIQLALLKPKEQVEKEGLSEMRFKALNTIYPSYSKRDNVDEVNRFNKTFKSTYQFEPTENVMQGFDSTFDSLIRLFQDKSFEATAKDEVTEQINYKFQYSKDQQGGYSNKGGYVLQIDSESSTKIAN